MKNKIIFFTSVLLLFCINISSNESATTKLLTEKDSITVFSSPDLSALSGRWATEYELLNPGIKIQVIPVTEKGIAELKSGANLGFVSHEYYALLKSEADAEREERILLGEQQRMNDLLAANPELVLQSDLRTFFPGGIPAPGEKGKPDKKKPGKKTPSMEPFMKPGVKPGGKKEPVEDKKKPTGPKNPKRPPRNTKVDKGETHMGLKIVRKLANQEPFFSGPSWAKDGVIFFNVEHSYWIAAAKKGDKALAAYVHEHTCKELAAMMITVANDEARDRMREAFFEVFDDHYSRLTAQCG